MKPLQEHPNVHLLAGPEAAVAEGPVGAGQPRLHHPGGTTEHHEGHEGHHETGGNRQEPFHQPQIERWRERLSRRWWCRSRRCRSLDGGVNSHARKQQVAWRRTAPNRSDEKASGSGRMVVLNDGKPTQKTHAEQVAQAMATPRGFCRARRSRPCRTEYTTACDAVGCNDGCPVLPCQDQPSGLARKQRDQVFPVSITDHQLR